MTTLVLTISPTRAVLSQDRAIYGAEGQEPISSAPTHDVHMAADATFIGDGKTPKQPERLSEVCKITALPDRRMLIGGCGSWHRFAMWPRRIPKGDIDEMAGEVPVRLRDLVATIRSGVNELLIVHAGWSEREGRVIGYAYEQSTGFEPQRLETGHTMVPIVNPAAPDYDRLRTLWGDALGGRRVEAFHRSVFRNQTWSYRQGLLRGGIHLSSGYSMASVTESGARLLTGTMADTQNPAESIGAH